MALKTYDEQALVRILAEHPGVAEALSSLPQAGVITKENFSYHLTGLERFHLDRLQWHVNRAGGLGSSDMGAILRGFHPDYSGETGFGDAFKVIEHKLFMRLPDFETEHTKRGVTLEDLARAVLHQRFSAQTDTAALDAVRNGKSPESMPWLRGEPDDIVIIGGKRWLLDYKVPNVATNEIEFDYKVQMHHLKLLTDHHGVQIEGMLLVKLDLAPEVAQTLVRDFPTMDQQARQQLVHSLATLNLPGHGVRVLPVTLDTKLMNDIALTGQQVWNDYVMTGNVPKPKIDAIQVLSQQDVDKITHLANVYAMAKYTANDLDKKATEARIEMAKILKAGNVNAEMIEWPTDVISIKQKKLGKELIEEARLYGAQDSQIGKEKYSEQALLDEIRRLGGDPESPALKEIVPDAATAAQFLENMGVSTVDTDDVAVRLLTNKRAKTFLDASTKGVIDAFEQVAGGMDSAVEPQAVAESAASPAPGPRMG